MGAGLRHKNFKLVSNRDRSEIQENYFYTRDTRKRNKFNHSKMRQMDRKIIELAIIALQTKQVAAWVDHYDAGEDDEKVIKVMLPMVAIAVLACVLGYYIKNKFFKDDEDKEEKEKNEQKKTADMRFPAPKANKPWLNNGQPVNKLPIGPTGGYEFTLPGYQQSLPNYKQATAGSTEKKASPSSRVQHVSEKRSSNYTRTKSHEKSRSLEKGSSRSQEKSSRPSEHKSRESRHTRPSGQQRSERSSNPNYRSHQPRSNRPSSGHQR